MNYALIQHNFIYIYIYTVYIYIANLANLAHQTLYTLCSEI